MASKLFMPNSSYSVKNVSCPRKKNLPISASSNQVCMPNKSIETFPSSSFSLSRQKLSSSSIAISEKSSSNSKPLALLWREIQGCNNWDGLVDPLHHLLRQEIIRYGEFVTACYKAFDLDPNSTRYLSCKYGKKNMLNQVGMGNSGYQVTKYIYVTPDVNIPIQDTPSCGRWIGYVAVSSDDTVKRLGRRDIVITFRGTVTNQEWVANFMSSLEPARLDPLNPRPEVKVELGFLNLYTSGESNDKFGLESCRQQLLSEVSRLLNKYKGEEISISIAGHSMGSSLGLLLAYDISEIGLNRVNNHKGDIPVTVFSFGGPRVGNAGFKERCEELGVKVLRIVNVNDPITKLPGVLLNENFRVLGGKYEFPWSCSCYAHVGVELLVDFFNIQNPSHVHDLEAYIESLLKKCPNLKQQSVEDILDHHQEDDLLNRINELLFSAENFNLYPLQIALSNIINTVQSQKTESFFSDENILRWVNSLALYIFSVSIAGFISLYMCVYQ
ncbi:hypothetical protein JCGZ_23817 [Jatropha curcas]|uniref:Fungal lipase-type domain-containing protein n=1 Tax=Jatropha curcas TaxID=180498 RepID=A0A067LED7_JATCU|nr:galactolipase DONGLE, chloroplastic [Jatropha curcas]KDP42875.1 hypothetical protein JCGZ_23817 [Jatropha curcas]